MDAGKSMAITGALTHTVMTSPLAGMTPAQISDLSQASGLNPETSQALGETIVAVNEVIHEVSTDTRDAEDAAQSEPIDEADYNDVREAEQANILDSIGWDENDYTSVEIENSEDSDSNENSEFDDGQSCSDSEGGEF